MAKAALAGITILMADDDRDDCTLAEDAFREARLATDLRFVHDGEELLAYLRREGPYEDPEKSPRPGMILLDLNMPRKNGQEALQEIRADISLRSIPIIILTTSKEERDVLRTYELGANSYIIKPVTFESLVKVMKTLAVYWFEIVELPRAPRL